MKKFGLFCQQKRHEGAYLAFIFIAFILPIVTMLFRSVENDIVATTLPQTVAALETWDSSTGELPDEAVYAAFASDIQKLRKQRSIPK